MRRRNPGSCDYAGPGLDPGFCYYIGAGLCFLAAVFILVTIFSAPILDGFAVLTVKNLAKNSTANIGIFGYCGMGSDGSRMCSPARLGDTPSKVLSESGFPLIPETTTLLTHVMVIVPAAGICALNGSMLATSRTPILIFVAATFIVIATFLCGVVDAMNFEVIGLIMLAAAKENPNGPHSRPNVYASQDVGGWLLFTAFVALVLSNIVMVRGVWRAGMMERKQRIDRRKAKKQGFRIGRHGDRLGPDGVPQITPIAPLMEQMGAGREPSRDPEA